jgi:hypothetical protein
MYEIYDLIYEHEVMLDVRLPEPRLLNENGWEGYSTVSLWKEIESI